MKAAPPEPHTTRARRVIRMSDAAVSLALLGAYVILTLTGNDGTAILGLLGGYLARAGVQSGIEANARSGR